MDKNPVSYQRILPCDELRHLSARSNGPGILHLAGHIGWILATGYLVSLSLGSGWLWPAMFVHGIGIVFLFTTLHEAIHRTAFRSRWLNGAVAWICGVGVALPPDWFRAFHFAHHRHTQQVDRDPELAGKRVDNWTGYLIFLSGWRYWATQARTLVRHAAGNVDAPFVSLKLKPRVVREARIFLVVYAIIAVISYYFGSGAALIYWVLPSLLAQPLLRAYLLAEHTDCPMVADMFENTRTTFTLALVRFIAWNMPYHTEHHAWPSVPFHALPELHRHVQNHLQHTANGYTEFHCEHVRLMQAGKT